MTDDVPASSPLAGLRARRQQIIDAQHLTLPVPRWTDPEIVVTYRPLSHSEAVAISRRTDKIKDPAVRQLAAAQDQIITACVAVHGVLDGKRLSLRLDDPDGEPTTFDADLAANLGLSDASARGVVSALFLTDGDVFAHCKRLVEWSGYAEAEADEEFAGEA